MDRPRHLLLAYGMTGALFLGILAAAYAFGDVEARILINDPTETLNGPTYVGVLSNLGAVSWAMGGAIALAVGWTLARSAHDGDGQRERAMAGLGAASVLLAADDLFRFHDGLFDDVFAIPEVVTQGVLGLLVLALTWRHVRTLLASPTGAWLVTALFFLAISLAIDVVDVQARGLGVGEDGAKFLGIVGCTAANVLGSARLMTDRTASP